MIKKIFTYSIPKQYLYSRIKSLLVMIIRQYYVYFVLLKPIESTNI